MKLKRFSGNPILINNPKNYWEAGSVFNPNVLYDNGIYRMIYRATNDIQIGKKGRYLSSVGYAESIDGIHFKRSQKPLIIPDQEYESILGCEDARVTKIDNTYFLYYTAVGGTGDDLRVRIALATSKNFRNWIKHGIVGPQYTRSKSAILFPEKINGKYIMLYTWMSDGPLSSIMQARFDTLEDVIKPPKDFMADNINHYEENVVLKPPALVFCGPEVGAVPIKTNAGWLLIYVSANSKNYPEWTISAALLDLHDPHNVLAITDNPILTPETETELYGVVNNVTSASGAVLIGDELYLYYGCGDQGCCLANCNLTDLLKDLTSQIT